MTNQPHLWQLKRFQCSTGTWKGVASIQRGSGCQTRSSLYGHYTKTFTLPSLPFVS